MQETGLLNSRASTLRKAVQNTNQLTMNFIDCIIVRQIDGKDISQVVEL